MQLNICSRCNEQMAFSEKTYVWNEGISLNLIYKLNSIFISLAISISQVNQLQHILWFVIDIVMHENNKL